MEKAGSWKNCGQSSIPRGLEKGRSRATESLLLPFSAAGLQRYICSTCKSVKHHPSIQACSGGHVLEEACAVGEVRLIQAAGGKGAEHSTQHRAAMPSSMSPHQWLLPAGEGARGQGRDTGGAPRSAAAWLVPEAPCARLTTHTCRFRALEGLLFAAAAAACSLS